MSAREVHPRTLHPCSGLWFGRRPTHKTGIKLRALVEPARHAGPSYSADHYHIVNGVIRSQPRVPDSPTA